MNRCSKILILLLVFYAYYMPAQKTIQPPTATVNPTMVTHFGNNISDPYAWMRKKESPEMMDYLKAENAYTDAFMKPLKKLQKSLYSEFLSRIKEDDNTVPYQYKGYKWFSRTAKGKEFVSYVRIKDGADKEEVYFDENKMNASLKCYSSAPLEWSSDLSVMAYNYDKTGSFEQNVRFVDMTTGNEMADELKRVTSLVICSDNRTVFYTQSDSVTNRSYRLYKHTLGTDNKADLLVYEEENNIFEVEVYTGSSEKIVYQLRTAASAQKSELLFCDATGETSEFKMMHARESTKHMFWADDDGERFYILSDKNAENFNLMTCPLANYQIENWQPFMPYDSAIFTEDFTLMKDYVVLSEKANGLNRLHAIDLRTKSSFIIPANEPCYLMYAGRNPDRHTNVFRYAYQSPVTPSSVYQIDLASHETKLLKQEYAGDNYNSSDYECKRVWATATDGAQIPVSVVYRKDMMKKDGSNPLWLYAYGAYGISEDDYFNPVLFSLLDRGFVYAVAHIRGGSEMGMQWYEQGKMMNKKNTFTDFIASAQKLIDEKYTSGKNIIAEGASAGGLTVGAVVNMQPALWKGVVLDVPFVDVINTMSDESLPLTSAEWDEWGNPAIQEQYNYMLSYSPYDNIKAVDYPSMLFVSGYSDEQVGIWEPAKMVARLRATKTDSNPLLFKVTFGGGHWGNAGRYKQLKEIAFRYSWALMLFGKANT